MYKYSTKININDNEKYDNFIFGIKLQSKTKFSFLNFHVEFVSRNEEKRDAYLIITYYRENDDLVKANEELKNMLNSLAFIFNIPLEGAFFSKNENVVSENLIQNDKSIDKVEKINLVSNKILKFKASKDLYHHSMKLFSIAQRYNLMYGFNEDAYLTYFKMIENLANNELDKDKQSNRINISNDRVKIIIKELLEDSFKVKYTENKLNDITGKIKQQLLNLSTDNTFFYLSWFLNKYNIEIDEYELQEAIEIRNKIAHGNYISVEKIKNSYGFVQGLCYSVIANKFFSDDYKNIAIESHFEVN